MKGKKYYVWLLFVLVVLCAGCNKKANNEVQQSKKEESIREEIESIEFTENPTQENVVQENTCDNSEIDLVEVTIEQEIEELLCNMTLEEKVAQLFVVLPEMLMPEVDCVTAGGSMTQAAINEIPVGGFVYMCRNLQSKEQVQEMLSNVQAYSVERIGVPAFLCVDEEGGTVTRVSGTGRFDVPEIGDMSSVGQLGDLESAYEIGCSMGEYLSELGFNVDFAPVADVLSNAENQVVKRRSFGSDANLVSEMSLKIMEGLEENNVYATYKHFPGHGMTVGDTHEGYAYSDKSLEEIGSCELVPFQKGIEEGISFIMVGHISLPEIVGDNTPASLSEYIISDLLREQMGYEGIVITDALNMGAIVQQYSSKEAAVKTIQAGADLILMPSDFFAAYEGVLDAVKNDVLSIERIDQSLTRILKVKLQMKYAQ